MPNYASIGNYLWHVEHRYYNLENNEGKPVFEKQPDMIKHTFYKNEEIILQLEDALEYDTAVPFKYALKRLKQIRENLSCNQIQVVSNNEKIEINNIADFKYWIENYFNPVFIEYIFNEDPKLYKNDFY